MNICHYLSNILRLSLFTCFSLVYVAFYSFLPFNAVAQQSSTQFVQKDYSQQSNALYAQHFSPFPEDDLDDDFDEMDSEIEDAFLELDADLEAQFNALHEAIQKAFSEQAKKIEGVWQQDAVVPNGQVWVAYSPTLKERVVYDFEQGYYQIEVKAEQDPAKSLNKLKEFAKSFEQNKTQNLQQMDVFGKAIAQEVAKIKPQDKPINSQSNDNENIKNIKQPEQAKLAPEQARLPAKNQQIIEQGKVIKPANYDSIVAVTPQSLDKDIDRLIESATSQSDTPIKSADSETKAKQSNTGFVEAELAKVMNLEQTESGWSIKVPFVNNYQQRLIDERMPTIIEMSKKYDVDVSLILAIIEAESSFNPMATSHIPAFGLMQLVPKTAGIDAYRHVYGYKKILSPDYLYDVENNLELGTAYIDVLQSRYLRGITNEQNKLYSIVASYNTGVGNLAKTMTGKNRVRQAIGDINQLPPDDYFEYLQQNLPALETKNYLNKVLSKREKYQHLDGT